MFCECLCMWVLRVIWFLEKGMQNERLIDSEKIVEDFAQFTRSNWFCKPHTHTQRKWARERDDEQKLQYNVKILHKLYMWKIFSSAALTRFVRAEWQLLGKNREERGEIRQKIYFFLLWSFAFRRLMPSACVPSSILSFAFHLPDR